MTQVHSGPLVLVVDDDPDTRELYRVVLETGGYRVEEAATIADAVSIAVDRQPHIVVCDWLLPDGDGMALCHQLRSAESERRIPLLAITGMCLTREQLEAAQRAGYSEILEKPVTPTTIVHTIRVLLEPALARRIGSTDDQ